VVSPAPERPEPLSVAADRYALQLPDGWRAVCVEDGAGACGNMPADVNRAAFVSGTGTAALRLTVDRYSGKDVTIASVAEAIDQKLAAELARYERDGAIRTATTAPGRRAREFSFTSTDEKSRAGTVDVFRAGGEIYAVTATAANATAARDTAVDAAALLEPR
jgi:hypothetical protein